MSQQAAQRSATIYDLAAFRRTSPHNQEEAAQPAIAPQYIMVPVWLVVQPVFYGTTPWVWSLDTNHHDIKGYAPEKT